MLKIMDSTTPSRFLSPDPCPNEHFQSLRFVQYEMICYKMKAEYYIAYALSNLTFRDQHSSFAHLLLLCGDVELNPGPSGQLCSVCNRVVNKRSLFCSNCNIAVHKNVRNPGFLAGFSNASLADLLILISMIYLFMR